MSGDGPKMQRRAIPRDAVDDYTHHGGERRRAFIREVSGADLTHVAKHSFDPALLQGNIEDFIGVAQVPIGVAGPLRINGEHAQGDFFVPLATTEGALVASYNRGMRLLTECGGVKTTVVERTMQRAPVFVFDDAAAARVRPLGREQFHGDQTTGGSHDPYRQTGQDPAVCRWEGRAPGRRTMTNEGGRARPARNAGASLCCVGRAPSPQG